MGTKNSKKKPAKRRLQDLKDVRRFLAHIINELNRDEIDPTKAGKLGYLCQVLSRIIEGGDIERRVDQIEKTLSSMEDSRK